MSGFDATRNLADIEFLAFDVETTGLSPVVARLVELSGVKFKLFEDSVTVFSELINPGCPIPPEASAVHGITDAMVAEARTYQEVVPDFLDFVGAESTVMVAHNAPFDISFLKMALERLNRPLPKHHVIDTLTLSRQLLPASPNHQLRTLVEFLRLEAGDYHRALADSHHVRHLLASCVQTEPGIQNWGELISYSCIMRLDGADDDNLIPPAVRESVDSIKVAIQSSMEMSFVYNGYSRKERKVKPLAVAQNRGLYYLTAHCYYADEERTFRVDRISALKTFGGP
ncbi:MAG TPA: exonuclease domain-containing protein [Chroococcales cyanobacterium]